MLRRMRRTSAAAMVTAVLTVCSTCHLFSQGLVFFDNITLVDAPVYDVDGITPLTGPEFLAGLYAAAPGQSLQLAGSPRPFLSAYPGYFAGSEIPVPGVPPYAHALVQVVAWRASDGPTFAAANHPGGHVGQSVILDLELGSPGPPPGVYAAQLTGLRSFSLYVVVPEPSSGLLMLRGAAVFAWLRYYRRKVEHKDNMGWSECAQARYR